MTEFIKNCTADTYACVVHGQAEFIGKVAFSNYSVAVIGNEGNGLTEKTVNMCKHCVTIPMQGRAESRNAAAAASIVMWEMVK